MNPVDIGKKTHVRWILNQRYEAAYLTW